MIMRLCSICARGGSKGVKNKNLFEINGVPLIGHSIRQALESKLFDSIAVSSDSPHILEVAKKFGANILVTRPDELATDTAAKLPVIKHCHMEAERISNLKFDIICDLDATSPLRNYSDIVGAVSLMERRAIGNVITGALSRRSPYFNLVEESVNGTVNLAKQPSGNIVRRQDAPKTFDMNASIYVWTRSSLLESKKIIDSNTWIFEMPEERSLDIDSPFDLRIVKFLMENPL